MLKNKIERKRQRKRERKKEKKSLIFLRIPGEFLEE